MVLLSWITKYLQEEKMNTLETWNRIKDDYKNTGVPVEVVEILLSSMCLDTIKTRSDWEYRLLESEIN